jgi:hypothetical protein
MRWVLIRKAKGVAEIGELVRYFDIANQNENVFKVIEYPQAGKIVQGVELPSNGYKLIDVESEDLIIKFSDLRQHGWDVLEKLEV